MNNNNVEKRQELRLSAQETLFVEVDSGSERGGTSIVICNCVDISANGLQMILDRSLHSGNIHRICLQLAEPETRLYLSALVIWSRALPESEGYAVGMQVLESEGTDVLRWKEWIAERCTPDTDS